MRFVIFIQGLENIETFSSRPRPRPRPFFMSSRHLGTKTKVSRLHPCFIYRYREHELSSTNMLAVNYQILKMEK